MRSLKFKFFHLLSLLIVGTSSAAEMLPAADPFPAQEESIGAEVELRSETAGGVAIPTTSASYFAVTGFSESGAETDPGDDGSLSFCHSGKWSTACLTGLIIYRCGQYTYPLTPYGCALTAAAFVDALELKRVDVVIDGLSYSLPVILTRRLEKLIQNRNTQMDIQSLRHLLVAAAKGKRTFDLWSWSWTMTNGSLEKTLENLAVLLQDTSGVAIQIQYLKGVSKARGFSAATIKAIDDLDEITYQLNSDILKTGDWKSWLRLYPHTKNIEQDTTPLIYHFYPMAYLALKLKNAGYGNRLSSFVPFLFNTEYLAQTLDPMQWPFKHPKPFKIDSDAKRWSLRDNYGGLAGALWGVQKHASLPGLAKFQTDYAKNPYGTMRHYFWSMPNR